MELHSSRIVLDYDFKVETKVPRFAIWAVTVINQWCLDSANENPGFPRHQTQYRRERNRGKCHVTGWDKSYSGGGLRGFWG